MMSEIDWSKAPEGATHWVGGDEPWHKHIDEISWYWQESEQRWRPLSICAEDVEDEYRRTIVKRPLEQWTGAGLPPIGAVCEFYWGGNDWRVCTVFAHKPNANGKIDVLVDLDGDWSFGTREHDFRPIRTQEQIEAEEREAFAHKLVEEMGKSPTGYPNAMNQARKIYDLGYRKQGEQS